VYHLVTDLPTLASLAEEATAIQGHEPQRLPALDNHVHSHRRRAGPRFRVRRELFRDAGVALAL
jgi:hypothetical protein